MLEGIAARIREARTRESPWLVEPGSRLVRPRRIPRNSRTSRALHGDASRTAAGSKLTDCASPVVPQEGPCGLTSHTHLSHAGMNADGGKPSLARPRKKVNENSGRSKFDPGLRQLSTALAAFKFDDMSRPMSPKLEHVPRRSRDVDTRQPPLAALPLDGREACPRQSSRRRGAQGWRRRFA